MCVIAAKPKGVKMPTEKEMCNMWNRNPDGAGIMYTIGGKVHIEKGFMDYDSFADKIEELDEKYDLEKIAVVMHFRITTHGGTKPENCHPFPISDSIGMLRKLKLTTDLGVAHNGIIHVTPRKDISDTMEYIAGQLAPLRRAVKKFYKDKNLMQMIAHATDSKLAFLTDKSEIYTVGSFVEHNGIMYSNRSYEKMTTWRDTYYGKWDTNNGWTDCAETDEIKYELKLQWLDDAKGEFVLDDENKFGDGQYAIDKYGNVYELDYDEFIFYHRKHYRAYDGNGFAMTFDETSRNTTTEVVVF